MLARALVLLAALAAAPVSAAVHAQPRVVGLSRDGRYLALEEWGEYDAVSGYWSRITVIDGDSDRRVHSPFDVQNSETSVSSETTRAQALKLAQPTLERLKIEVGRQGTTLPLAFASEDKRQAAFERDGVKYRLVLHEKTAAATDYCDNEKNETTAFALFLVSPAGERPVHDDAGRVPVSRGYKGCVDRYELYGARALGRYLYVLVEVWSRGFEGQDTSFLPIAVKL